MLFPRHIQPGGRIPFNTYFFFNAMLNHDPNTYKLLTPGPLTTTLSVREAMLIDRCTWDEDYKAMTQDIRARLLKLAHAGNDYTTVLMQGSGTFGVESVLSSLPGPDDHVLVLVNGAYSKRMCEILDRHHIAYSRLDFNWAESPDAKVVESYLNDHPEITMVSMVHNETTTGLLNDIASVANVVKSSGRTMIVDAMSSFGAVDIDLPKLDIDVIISSANKCIQGVPGFSFIIVKRTVLESSKGNARTLSLDLYDQWHTLENDGGKWRFTSPTHVVAAFHKALIELDAEGGVGVRGRRYAELNRRLREGMESLGFTAYIPQENQGPIITTFFYPSDDFSFKDMYQALKNQGYVIYPGKLTERPSFRLGNIGEIYLDDVEKILELFNSYMASRPMI